MKRYLADCRRFAHQLRAADHPTAAGMLKIVHTASAAEKEMALLEYRETTCERN